jgi:signal transduction histidine kinase
MRRLRSFGSLRLRVSVGAAAVIGVVLVGTSTVVVHSVRSSIRDQIRSEGQALTRGIATQVTAGSITPTLGLQPMQGSAGPVPLPIPATDTPAFVQVIGANGRVVARSATPPPGGRSGITVAAKPGTVLEVSAPARTPGGRVHVVAELPLTRVQRSVDAVISALQIAIPLLVVTAAGLAWLVVGRALRPVEAIRTRVDEITHTTIDRRVGVPASRDEIGRLARTMNEMLARLETASRRQREFISNASHELRSPLATAHAILEAATRAPQGVDWPQVAHDTLGEQERLAAIIDELLDLANFDETSASSLHRAVDLDEIVFAEARRIHGTAIDLSGVSGARVDGDPMQLTRVIRNLLLNAQRHARSRIAVTVVEHDDAVILTIDDDGPGIPQRDRHRVFERFVRLDQARNREHGGVGLGLALVASIVQHHHGTVVVTDSPLSGARLQVSLPRIVEVAPPTRTPV